MASWSPQLADPPEIANVLLNGLRRAIPALFDAALHGYALLGVEGAEPGSVSLPFSLAW